METIFFFLLSPLVRGRVVRKQRRGGGWGLGSRLFLWQKARGLLENSIWFQQLDNSLKGSGRNRDHCSGFRLRGWSSARLEVSSSLSLVL